MPASEQSASGRNIATMRLAAWWNNSCRCWITLSLALKSDGTAEQLRSGVELIVKQMEDILRQFQVQPVAAIGEAFDPRHA